MAKKQETVNTQTGEIENAGGTLNEVLEIHVHRPDGTIGVMYDYQYCPTMAEQHTAHLTDINWLMDTYKPDELAAYISAKNASRPEITGHDFSTEPSLQEARNITYRLKTAFEALDPEVKSQFKNHVEFLKFIDNPANQEKMLKLGLMTKREIQQNSTNDPNDKSKNSDLAKTTETTSSKS